MVALVDGTFRVRDELAILVGPGGNTEADTDTFSTETVKIKCRSPSRFNYHSLSLSHIFMQNFLILVKNDV